MKHSLSLFLLLSIFGTATKAADQRINQKIVDPYCQFGLAPGNKTETATVISSFTATYHCYGEPQGKICGPQSNDPLSQMIHKRISLPLFEKEKNNILQTLHKYTTSGIYKVAVTSNLLTQIMCYIEIGSEVKVRPNFSERNAQDAFRSLKQTLLASLSTCAMNMNDEISSQKYNDGGGGGTK